MRYVFRIISIAFLLLAVIVGIYDALQSVVSNKITLASLGENWGGFHPESLTIVETLIQLYLPDLAWDPAAQWVLLQPSSIIFLVISLLFYMISYRRERPEDRFLIR